MPSMNEYAYNPELLSRYGITMSAEEYAQNASKKVVVGMSGGVDSSVSALILKLQGYQVVGLFMKNWDETDASGNCSADNDYQDVIKVCERLDMPYYSVNFVKEYWDNVFATFLQEYKEGHTPNPDILCNREIKFKVFYEKAMLLGADYLATGHYCQLTHKNGYPELVKGKDGGKDQTYFLYAVNADVFNKVLFPIGHLEKKLVRQLATEFNLATMSKKDSTGICFIGERPFKEFLSQYIESSKGHFVDLSGKVLGKHDGVCFYTLGQRKGLGVGGPGEPWFVAKKDMSKNEVTLVQGETHPALYADGLEAVELNWITPVSTLSFPLRCSAKVRYRQQDRACTVDLIDGKIKVIFDEPQRSITNRQSVVLYQGDVCLGGGIIQEVSPTYYELNKALPKITSVQVE